ncbi:hypothetical protein D3C81_1894480 [compost metagenome]
MACRVFTEVSAKRTSTWYWPLRTFFRPSWPLTSTSLLPGRNLVLAESTAGLPTQPLSSMAKICR